MPLNDALKLGKGVKRIAARLCQAMQHEARRLECPGRLRWCALVTQRGGSHVGTPALRLEVGGDVQLAKEERQEAEEVQAILLVDGPVQRWLMRGRIADCL